MKSGALFLAGCLAVAGTQARPEPPAVGLLEPWSNLFAGKDVVFHATLDGEAFEGRIVWHYGVLGRTIARGERAVKSAAGVREEVEIRLATPEVNPGVIVAAQLAVKALEHGSSQEVGGVERTLWVFPTDPFIGRTEWLKNMDIRLLDPEGATSKLFDETKVPYTGLRNVDAFGDSANGLLVVGEGVSFRNYRGLWDRLVRAAAAGRPVLCLAPVGGEITLPVAGSPETPQPRSIMLRRQDIITELDKRFDAGGWTGDCRAVAYGLKLRGDRGPVAAEVVREDGAWPWMEMTFGKEKGRLVLCGFGIVGGWAKSPTPRFLLVRMLEHVSGDKLRE